MHYLCSIKQSICLTINNYAMKKIASVFCVMALALASFTAAADQYELYPRGDVSEDGVVDISDVSALINLPAHW